MPTRTEHINKADGNEAFAASLPMKTNAQIDWALIARFYAAVHYVEAYLAPTQHLTDHHKREKLVGLDANLRKIYSEYNDLKYYGFTARYQMVVFTRADVALSSTQFAKLKAHIQKLL